MLSISSVSGLINLLQHEETPVLIATKRGNKEIVQELLNNHADPNMVRLRSSIEICEVYLCDSSTQGNVAPMMIAINLGHKEIADLLSDHGADLYREHEVYE